MDEANKKYFSEENLRKITDSYSQLQKKADRLALVFTSHNYKTEKGAEYGKHGFARRIWIIARSIKNVFEAVPIDGDRTTLPRREKLLDATINIQASLINIFGAIDNLAWIWVEEKGVRLKNGKPLPKMRIGFGPRYEEVRNSFSDEFRGYVSNMDGWITALGDFRDGLAHRISPYIPPSTLDPKKRPRFDELETKRNASISRGDFDESDRLLAEQNALMVFQPYMQHSFGEGVTPLVFHPQLIANFATVEELGSKFLSELKKL